MDTRRQKLVWVRSRVRLIAATAGWLLGCSHSVPESAPSVEPAVAAAAPSATPAASSAEAGANPSPSTRPSPSPDSAGDKLLVTEDEYQGWKYFAVYCERCHGPDALGTVDAPDLRYSVSSEGQVTADSFRVIVRKGTENVEENRVMKGFEELLDDQRIDQVYAYVVARSEGRLAPGRPHRRPPS